MPNEFNLIFTTSMIIVFLILSVMLLTLLFKQATKNRAYVRTGYGGEVVVLNKGIFIIPFLHHAIAVNLKSMSLIIELNNESAVLTRDYMKANLSIVFYVRVDAEKQSISQVARTLGELTLCPEKLKDFLSGQFIHAIRKIASEMTMDEIHQQSNVFVEKIQHAVTADLKANSIHIDNVTLNHLNQSATEFYSEDDVFEAKGLSGLAKIIQSEKQVRHELEQQTVLLAKQKDLEMEKLIIEMENKKHRLRLEQQREIKIFEAANELRISQDAIKKSAEETQSKILADQDLEITKHQSEIFLAEKLREKLKQQIETDLIKAEAEKASVHVKLTRKLEKADNLVKIKLLDEQRKNEHEIANIVQSATARKHAADEDAEALKIKTEGEAERLKILIDTFNSLSKSELPQDIYPELIELFSALCLEKNQGSFIGNQKANVYNFDPLLSKDKSNEPISHKNNTKLKAILADARNCLTKEAMDTINNSEVKNDSDLFKHEESTSAFL